MKKGFLAVLSASMLIGMVGCSSGETSNKVDLTVSEAAANTYVYDAAADGFESIYSNVLTPQYYVFAGMKTEEEAEALIQDLDMMDNIQKWASAIQVITPLDGKAYTEKDKDAFIGSIVAASNVKVIGIDEGADFVNKYLAPNSYFIAGIMTYNGTMEEGTELGAPVPAYLSNADDAAVEYYVKANEAKEVEDGVYVNADNELQKVVVKEDEDLASAFDNAWDTVFSKNYRQDNEDTEFYMTAAAVNTKPYGLIGIADMDALNMEYNPHISEEVEGLEGKYTWFEYLPKDALEAEDGTVPLVISLHGNGNDARLQGDTSGWVELAAKEGFMVMAPEWQEEVLATNPGDKPGPNFFNCDGLYDDKLITWLEAMEKKYPQIDTSRIFVTGLSAGGSKSALYGVRYSKIFAGAASVSAPGVDREELAQLAKDYDGGKTPWLYVAGDHDFFGVIPVDGSSTNSFQVEEGVYMQNIDPNTQIFPFIQSYQKINGFEVSDNYDMSLNPYFGVKLEDEKTIQLGEKEALEGVLSDENGVLVKLTAIKDQAHWNYKPEAEYIWNFWKGYSRNTETGALEVNK